ncbi:hypothetical protein [Acinetobacter ursingii]|uniref:hypothetical protein n=1 Tax=Acinetobacter ursingii TaxID=108980 RepID=UPI00255105B0|nr:hypothetical protein [Acinetobacter ursingii]MEC6128314.1 hypothetical protein [Acinetobacter ursingii]
MSNRNQTNESEIATAAAHVLRQRFIAVAHSDRVLYVENDTLISKTPNGQPVQIKQLSGRNPELARHLHGRRTFKLRKRNVETAE